MPPGRGGEFDSLAALEVPVNRYRCAQTQRGFKHFKIGQDRMPKEPGSDALGIGENR
jgi:fumarate hydratase class II